MIRKNKIIHIWPEVKQICEKAEINFKQVAEMHVYPSYIEFYCFDWKDGKPYLNEAGDEAVTSTYQIALMAEPEVIN